MNWVVCWLGSFSLAFLPAYLVYASGARSGHSQSFFTRECLVAALWPEVIMLMFSGALAFGMNEYDGKHIPWVFVSVVAATLLCIYHYFVLMWAHEQAREERAAMRTELQRGKRPQPRAQQA